MAITLIFLYLESEKFRVSSIGKLGLWSGTSAADRFTRIHKTFADASIVTLSLFRRNLTMSPLLRFHGMLTAVDII